MRLRTPWFQSMVAAALLLSAMGACQCDEQANPERGVEPLTLQLHWVPNIHQVGFWAALDQGFYAQRGLQVTIHPGGLDAAPLKDALSGAADVGQLGGVEQACIARSEALPVKAIAAIHRQTPHALISLLRNPIRGSDDFPGRRIAVAFGDTGEVLLRSYMARAGVAESEVELVPFRYDITALLSGQVDAITGFSTGQPLMIEQAGQTPVVLDYATQGVSSYGYTLVASERTLASKGEAIRRFLAASREGFRYAFAHPDKAVALLRRRFKHIVDGNLATRELKLADPLMRDGDALATWKLDPQRVQAVIEFLLERGQLNGRVPTAAVFDNGYTE